jgi:3-hydroxyacyl-CoA dehydrogenase
LDKCAESNLAARAPGIRAASEGFAQRASDVDVVYVNGYGFPAWRGGPMCYADTVGLGKVIEAVERFERKFGPRWKPAPLLRRLAVEGRTFREFDRRA